MRALLTLALILALAGHSLAHACPCLLSFAVAPAAEDTLPEHAADCPGAAAALARNHDQSGSEQISAADEALCLHCSECMNSSAPPPPALLAVDFTLHAAQPAMRECSPPQGTPGTPLRPPIA